MGQIDLSRGLLWALLALPAAVIGGLYVTDVITYGRVLHVTGETSVRLLIVTLAATPLRLMFPRAGWTAWLMRRRRDLGVATFGYALFHAAAYLARKAQLDIILAEGRQPELLTGWLALLILLALAATSNNLSVRWLGRSWKRLHRLVYPAAILTFAHWLLEAFTLDQALIHAAVLIGLEATRLVLSRQAQSRVT